MIPYFTERFGHPGSRNHSFGWEAEAGMERAREHLARLIGARDPKELVWTSGGTEADNLAIKGVVERYREEGDHIVTVLQKAPVRILGGLELLFCTVELAFEAGDFIIL